MATQRKGHKKTVRDDPLVKNFQAGQKLEDAARTKISEVLNRGGNVEDLLPDWFRGKYVKLQEEAEKDLQKKIIQHKKNVLMNVGSYEDSDQTPLQGDELQFLKFQWSSGMDCNPISPDNDHLS